ncbi:lysophospholipase L1-like esterase [Rathayibacter sp. PhB93]|uniref:SGNH/GDSL hydrolase family protein n=1 Tax=unclassified Rathayibacter TaxID=2609250 RepID=UPI000F93FE98|nr:MULTISPECIES: GDSL-type esterase/lipase family protein [unclassified Rathayibacter]ROQ06615.1 lysophospholipase L1-like esterase [Rathayibacter sp. PhB93]TDQ14372.1 lysophospholipase L1-like esterase [Rathayibacter sp. PhB1]
MSPHRPRRSPLIVLGLAASVLAGGAIAPAAAAATPSELSVVAFGDSITRGAATCGTEDDCPVNSWSTGSAPEVRSIATRLQEVAPQRTVTTDNRANSGSRIAEVSAAVTAAQAAGAAPDVVTLLIGGNDLCSPDVPAGPDAYAMTPAADFSASASGLLRQISSAWPRATVLLGSVPDIGSEWEVVQGTPGKLIWGLFSICRTTRGAKADNHVQRGAAFEAAVAAAAERTKQYNDALASACSAAGPQCIWDGGALTRTPITKDVLSTVDYFHPNVAGQALVASVLWGPDAVPAWAVPHSAGAPAPAPADLPTLDEIGISDSTSGAPDDSRTRVGMRENVTERVALDRSAGAQPSEGSPSPADLRQTAAVGR